MDREKINCPREFLVSNTSFAEPGRKSKDLKTALEKILKVGKISYRNSLPFYHGLFEHPWMKRLEKMGVGVEFVETYPARMNELLHQGELDLGLVSSLEYLNHQKDYVLFPDMMIGARDFSGSVLLISRKRLDQLSEASIGLSSESLSSATLLRALLRFKYKFKNDFFSYDSSIDEALKNYDAVLVIGDTALFYQPEEFIFKYDLSELWWDWTKNPFCFALWAVRKKTAEEHPEALKILQTMIFENLERNLADLETLLKNSLELDFMHEEFAKMFGYLFNLNYLLDENAKAGLQLFYRLANRLKVSPKGRKLEFFGAKK